MNAFDRTLRLRHVNPHKWSLQASRPVGYKGSDLFKETAWVVACAQVRIVQRRKVRGLGRTPPGKEL